MTMTLEHKNRDLECEQARLEVSNKEAGKTFQQFTDSIQKDHIEKARLENIVDSIQLNNETCIKIKQIVKQEIESVMSDPRMMLRLALAPLFESSRIHPGKLQALYYNMPSYLSVEQILSQSSINQNTSQYRYSENVNEKLFLDEAEQSYSRIVDAITNLCINEMPKMLNNNELSFETSQIADMQGKGSNHETFDTRDLSQVNFVYNDITFQVYPGPKITAERKTLYEMDDRLGETEPA